MESVKVQNVQIPKIGFGTAGILGDLAQQLVGYALNIGYRHIDTAQNYVNEAEVGYGIKNSGIARSEIWLTTKVWPDRYRDGDLQLSVEESVRRLGTIPNLVLLHWPNRQVPLRETIAALNDVKRKGLCNHIGVSNFTVALIQKAVLLSEEPLIANQVEYHPYLKQWTVIETLRAKKMAMIAHSPLAGGKVFRDVALQSIGERYGKTAGQVALRWLTQQDVITIPGSSCEAHIAANLNVFDFELREEEMEKISAHLSVHGRLNDRFRFAPAWDDLGTLDMVRRHLRRSLWYANARARQFFR